MIPRFSRLACLVLFVVPVAPTAGETVAVGLDRWMYPFAFTGGTRDIAPTFGAVGTPGFDNRDAQFLIGFNTSASIVPGAGASNYQINSVTVRAMAGGPAGFAYDPTYDSFRTYLLTGDPDLQPDTDAGRPIELHGVGFRNGYTQFAFGANDNQPPGFEESSVFGAMDVGTRNAFALGFLTAGAGSDVSNNVSDRTESNPWAVGTASLPAGDAVPDNTTFSFSLDLNDPDVRNYLQSGLNQGALGFAITSMHTATQGGGGPPTPQWVTRENAGGGAAGAVLEIDYQIVPEPSTFALVLGSIAIGGPLAYVCRCRRRNT